MTRISREYRAHVGRYDGWHMVDAEGNATHDITRDAAGGYVLTAIETDDEG